MFDNEKLSTHKMGFFQARISLPYLLHKIKFQPFEILIFLRGASWVIGAYNACISSHFGSSMARVFWYKKYDLKKMDAKKPSNKLKKTDI